MLEEVACAWWPPPLVEQLGRYQLRQPRLQGDVVARRQHPENFVGKLSPSTAAICTTSRASESRSNRAISESCSVTGMAKDCSGPVSS